MEGSAKIISLIARDEAQHLAITQHILKAYKNQENDKDMLKIMEETEDEVYAMYRDAVDQEKEWADFLFKDGSMIGLSTALAWSVRRIHSKQEITCIGTQPTVSISHQRTTHYHGLIIGSIVEDYRMHHKKRRLNPILLVVLNRMSKKTPLMDLSYDGCSSIDRYFVGCTSIFSVILLFR